jgi:curved DNA-binding protein
MFFGSSKKIVQMEFIDYYKILELAKSATDADIKKAYRRLARKYHPDLNPNDAAAKLNFQQVNEANEVLSDPEKRKKYDEHGRDWKHADEAKRYQQQRGAKNRQRPQYAGEGFSGDFGGGDFSDFFESMFGGQSSRRGAQVKFRGQDITAELHLNLKDVYNSQKHALNVNGKNIRLTIPAGVEHGQTIKIVGYGGEGVNGGPSGDLYISFSIENTTKFKRDGNNLHTEVELDLYTALLGGEVTIDTFDGQAKLVVKPETQTGQKVKLKGKGFPVYKKESEFGDLYITWKIKIPSGLTENEKELFRQLQKLRADGK